MMNNAYGTVVISRGNIAPLLNRHPWVFLDSIDYVDCELNAGDIVRVVAPDKRFLGWGLSSSKSLVKVRIYSFDEDELPSVELFRRKLQNAKQLREPFISSDTNCYRAVFAEGDGIPGLIVDKYGPYLAVTFTTAAIAFHGEMILDLLEEVFAPEGIVMIPDERLEKIEGFIHPVGVTRGKMPPNFYVTENGILYNVDINSAQRKMLYFDQRENRKFVASLVFGEMLDLYCYTGGFSLNAARYGNATKIYCTDSSEPAVESLTDNIRDNGFQNLIMPFKRDSVGLAWELYRDGVRFDVVIADPPRFVLDRSSFDRGIKKYSGVNEVAALLVRPGGLLVTCSCSGLVKSHDFLRAVAVAGVRAKREMTLVAMRGQGPDHPVSPYCPEGSYLKCAVFRVLK